MRWLAGVLLMVVVAGGIWWYGTPPRFEVVVQVLDDTTGEAPGESGPDVGLFTVQLSKNPRGSVTFSLISLAPDQGLPEASTLTFDSRDWDQPKTVTVIGQDEFIDDDEVAYRIHLFWEDPETERRAEAWVELLGLDDDRKRILIGHLPPEAADTARVQVQLATQPVTPVELWVQGGESSWNRTGLSQSRTVFKALAQPERLFFDASNWNVPQTVEVRSRGGSLKASGEAEARQNYDWVIRDGALQMQWLKLVVVQPHEHTDYRNFSHSVLINPERCLRCNGAPGS
jgi:hypothetical protein